MQGGFVYKVRHSRRTHNTEEFPLTDDETFTLTHPLTSHGEVAEWSNARAWKARVAARLPGVRIPPSPPASAKPTAGRPAFGIDGCRFSRNLRRLPAVGLAKEGRLCGVSACTTFTLLQSLKNSECHYVGFTGNLKKRLVSHNAGQNASTAPNRPWGLAAYFAFPDGNKARAFEQYLKSGSGRTFAKRHFL